VRIRIAAFVFFLLPRIATPQFQPRIPKLWDDQALQELQLPLAGHGQSPVQVSSDYYYRIPEIRPPKTYPVYALDREPPGYFEWIKQQPPQTAVVFALLKTKEDWVRAGETVFNSPFRTRDGLTAEELRQFSGPPFFPRPARDGTYPWLRYWVVKKGEVRGFFTACGSCHTRVLDDGTVVPGAQGNFNQGLFYAALLDSGRLRVAEWRAHFYRAYTAPWVRPDPAAAFQLLTDEQIVELERTIVPGVAERTGTSYLFPPKIADLIGVAGRRYLDATGFVQNRSIGDLMRYAELVDYMEQLTSYAGFHPFGNPPNPRKIARLSDEALYAVALFISSLKPPENPNGVDGRARLGEQVFKREGCELCHPPPLFTNNRLLPVDGFTVPQQHQMKYAILQVPIGVDPRLTLQSRKGTGYYRVPSLRGVWYRGPFEHNGSVATLEDWFDANRLREDYVPTGFRGYGVKRRAVKGHPFGLKLNAKEKAALIAYLKTL
jgi:hypothetical protein